MAGVESRKLAFRRSTNATASRHVVPTFPTGVFYVFVLINIMFLSYSITRCFLLTRMSMNEFMNARHEYDDGCVQPKSIFEMRQKQ